MDSLITTDREQVRLMDEECIVVSPEDRVLGHASKRTCHLMRNIRTGLLHRAFSVFLFNSRGELLLQQRSAAKITFPLRWTNTCCSHPLYFADELEEKDSLGVRRAAIRKLGHELGIPAADLPIDHVHFLTRILYMAESDGTEWGEHEVDHILFIKLRADQPFHIAANSNEVASVQWVNAAQLRALFAQRDQTGQQFITPWFEMIANQFLYPWWAQLDTIIAARGLPADQRARIYHLSLSPPSSASSSSTATSRSGSGSQPHSRTA